MRSVVEAITVVDFYGVGKDKLRVLASKIREGSVRQIEQALGQKGASDEDRFVINYILALSRGVDVRLEDYVDVYYKNTEVERIYKETVSRLKQEGILSRVEEVVQVAIAVLDSVVEKYIRKVLIQDHILAISNMFSVASSRSLLSTIQKVIEEIRPFMLEGTDVYGVSLSSHDVVVKDFVREQIMFSLLKHPFRHTLFISPEPLYSTLSGQETGFEPLPLNTTYNILTEYAPKKIRLSEYIDNFSYQYLPLDRSTFMLFSAVTGGGKSLFLLNLAVNLVINNNINLLYISNELPYKQILERVVKILFAYNYFSKNPKSFFVPYERYTSLMSEYSAFTDRAYRVFSDFVRGKYSDSVVVFDKDLSHGVFGMLSGRMYIWELEYAKYKASSVFDRIVEFTETSGVRFDVVVVDYIEPFAKELGPEANSYQELGYRAGVMRQFAKSHNALVVCATQERIVEKKKTKQDEGILTDVDMSSIAESKKMLFISDFVMSLRAKHEERRVLFKTLKNRQGPKDFVTYLSYYPEFFLIDSLHFYENWNDVYMSSLLEMLRRITERSFGNRINY